MFRRRKKDAQDDAAQGGALEDGAVDAAEQDEEVAAAPVVVRPQGPWDVEDAPEDELQRIDLGGLRVPVPPGHEVRVDVNPEGEVVAATLVAGTSAMQVNVFAAPRTSGIWDEVRTEIAASVTGSGGRAVEAEGRYGTELRALVPVQSGGAAAARFLGVDGPRWFVRALITGPAAQDLAVAASLEDALARFVVVRGSEAMAVRDPLPLRLPKEVVQQAGSSAAAPAVDEDGELAGAPAGGPDPEALQLPERGPEITERR